MQDRFPLLFADGSRIEIYADKSGTTKIGEDTLKGNRDFSCTYCPQVNDQGEDVRYTAFECNPTQKTIKVVFA